jgi:hypothetical protein
VINILVVENFQLVEPALSKYILLQPISYGSPNHATRLRNTAEIDETPVAEQGPFDFRDFVEVS